MYIAPEFLLGQVYDGANPETIVLYRPVYVAVRKIQEDEFRNSRTYTSTSKLNCHWIRWRNHFFLRIFLIIISKYGTYFSCLHCVPSYRIRSLTPVNDLLKLLLNTKLLYQNLFIFNKIVRKNVKMFTYCFWLH